MYKKVISLLIVVITIGMSIIPAQAASVYEPFMCDMLISPEYDKYENGKYVSTSIRSVSWFSGITSAAWSWWGAYDYVCNEYYLTFRASRQPDSLKVRLFSSQNWFEGEYIGNVGNTYQYKVDIGSNVGEITIQADFNSSYTGNFDLLSFVGMRSFINAPSRVNISGRRDYISTSGTHEIIPYIDRDNVKLPYYCPAAESLSGVWQGSIIDVDVTPDQRQYDNIDEITFIVAGNPLFNFDIQLLDNDYNTVAVLDTVYTQAIGNSVNATEPHDYPINFYELTADLSGYDLQGLTIRLTFEANAFDQSGGRRWVYFQVNKVYIQPHIEEIPWYKTFWNWLASKWDKVTTSITNAISTGVNKIVSNLTGSVQNAIDAEKNEAQQMGDAAIDNATGAVDEAIPNKSEGFMSAISTFTGSMSYGGTEAILTIPALSLPEIPGLIPRTVLMSEQEFDFSEYVALLPEGLVLLVRSLLTIALIIYCFKELYDTIAYLLTLRKGDN